MQIHVDPRRLLRASALVLLVLAIAAALVAHEWTDYKQCVAQRLFQLPFFFERPGTSLQEIPLPQGPVRLDQLARMPGGGAVKLVWSYRNSSSQPIEIGAAENIFGAPKLTLEPEAMLVDLRTSKAYFPALVAGVAAGRSVPRKIILEPGEQYAAWTFFANVPSDAHLFDVIVSGSHKPFHCVSDNSPP